MVVLHVVLLHTVQRAVQPAANGDILVLNNLVFILNHVRHFHDRSIKKKKFQ